jgi:GDPmannose 4,6-dehydratase
VTQKIATAAAEWKKSPGQVLKMGNIHVQRDWGHAKDFVRGMHCMLQQEQADDFVLATGVLHSVKDFISAAYQSISVELIWSGEGIEEQAHSAEGQLCVSIDPTFYRPSDIQRSLGNPIKARNVLNWQPEHSFEQIVQEMVESHL